MTFARFRNALDSAVKASQDRQIVYGLMGVPTPTGHTFASPQAGFVRVRIATKNGPAPTEARNDAGVPLRYDLPILMKRDANGALYIVGRNNIGGVADAATTEDAANPSGVTVHHHRSVAGADNAANPLAHVWEAKQIDRGRVKHAGGLSVNIAEFRYYYNGAYETWEGGDLDLTAYKPVTSGHHAWVVVGIDPATNTAVAVAGTSVVYATALTTAGIDDIAFGDYIPCAAVQVRNDDTQLSDITKYYDTHAWFTARVVHEAATQTLTNKTLNDLSNYIDADAVHFKVYNNSGGALTAGQAVYATQWNAGAGAFEVEKARANSSSTMPAIGLIEAAIADGAVGEARAVGTLLNLDTSVWSDGDELYVSPTTAGALTSTKPTTAGQLVQLVGTVVRQHATAGVIQVRVGTTLLVPTYIGLVDTPSTRTGKAGYIVQANSGETADEYADLWAKLNAAVVIAEDGNLVTHEGEIVWAI